MNVNSVNYKWKQKSNKDSVTVYSVQLKGVLIGWYEELTVNADCNLNNLYALLLWKLGSIDLTYRTTMSASVLKDIVLLAHFQDFNCEIYVYIYGNYRYFTKIWLS